MGVALSSDDAFLALRGMRTLAVRLKQHTESARAIARWLRTRPEVAEVIHPALEGSRGHELWKRDFTGACGLFGVILKPASKERVDAMLDALEFPDALPSDDDVVDDADEAEIEAEDALAEQGLDPQDVLSELFVAADRLKNDPLDHEGVLSLVDAARLAHTLPLPYGFAPAVWRDLLTQVDGLRAALEGDVDDEQVIDLATDLRTSLRQFV